MLAEIQGGGLFMLAEIPKGGPFMWGGGGGGGEVADILSKVVYGYGL